MMRLLLPSSMITFALALSAYMFTPPALPAATGGPPTVASGKGSSNDDKGDDDRSGNSGKGRSGSDDKGDDDSRGSGSSGGSSSSSSSSSSGSSSSNDDSSNRTSSNGSSSSADGASSSSPSSNSSTVTRSSRQIIEGKTRRQISGFQAELSIRREVRFDREKFRAEASSLNLGAGTRLAVCFGGASLGDIVLSSLNYGELELDSRRGQAIPDFRGGETVELRRGSCGGELVMAATFGGSAGAGQQSSPSVQDDSLIEGKSRRFLNGFEAELSVRLERRADRDKFRAEASSLNLGAGTRLDVCFGGAAVGDIFLNSLNFGELELDSRLGHSFPIFQTGDTVELRQGGCSGSLVMAATFGGSAAAAAGSNATASAARAEIEGKTRRVLQSFEAEFSVRFESRFDRDKIRAEVSNLNYPEGSAWTACFGGSALGELRLSPLHFAELELDSRLGHTVPVLQPGDVVSLHEGSSCSSQAVMSVSMGQGN